MREDPKIAIVVACDRNGAIGLGNRMPWKRLRRDLGRFARLTKGHPVVMGRKTFESIGRRPLPERDNIVVTRSADAIRAQGGETPGLRFVGSLEEAVGVAKAIEPPGEAARIFVIGGEEIYRQALPLADIIHLTKVGLDCEADRHFPRPDPTEWRETASESVDDDGVALEFIDLARIRELVTEHPGQG